MPGSRESVWGTQFQSQPPWIQRPTHQFLAPSRSSRRHNVRPFVRSFVRPSGPSLSRAPNLHLIIIIRVRSPVWKWRREDDLLQKQTSSSRNIRRYITMGILSPQKYLSIASGESWWQRCIITLARKLSLSIFIFLASVYLRSLSLLRQIDGA